MKGTFCTYNVLLGPIFVLYSLLVDGGNDLAKWSQFPLKYA